MYIRCLSLVRNLDDEDHGQALAARGVLCEMLIVRPASHVAAFLCFFGF